MLQIFSPPHLREEGRCLAEKNRELSGLVFATSGTTGAPKWILHSRDGLDWCARAINDHFNCTKSDVWGLALPEFHVGGFSLSHRAQLAGGDLARFEKKWEGAAFTQWAKEEAVTITSLVPTQVFDLVKAHQVCPPSLRLALIGGESLDKSIHAKALALGWPLVTSYGMTETAGLIAASQLGSTRLRPLAGWELKVGGEGQLSIAGPGLFAGYLTENGLHRVEPPFTTKDLVDISDGILTVRGRSDDQVKVLGELVDLATLRKGLAEASPGKQTTVIAVPDERRGHCLIPIIQGDEDNEETVQRWNQGLPAFSRCQPTVYLREWPCTPLGKTDFRALTREVANRQDSLLPPSANPA